MGRRLQRLKMGIEYSWILTLKESRAVVGSFSVIPEHEDAQLGFALASAAWGQGLVLEAGRAVLRWLAAQGETRRVWAACDVENTRSKRVLEKLGLQVEQLAEKYGVHPSISASPRDCYVLGAQLASRES